MPQSQVMFILFSVCSSIFYETSSKISNLLRSYSGECLGSSSDEERSELRYSIWIAEFRELLDLWTHAAFWLTPVCSFTGVFNSFFRHWATNGAACSAALLSGLARQTIARCVKHQCESTYSNRSGHPHLISHSRKGVGTTFAVDLVRHLPK